MQKTAIVRSLTIPSLKKTNAVLVEPIAFTECAGCNQSCSKKGITLPAINKKNLPLQVNSLVIISTSKFQEAIEGILSLLLPILMAIVGYLFSNSIFLFLQKFLKDGIFKSPTTTEGFKALCVVVFFALTTFIVLKITRARKLFIYPEIIAKV